MLPMDYTDAVDIESVRVSQDLRGRSLSQTEIAAIMRVIKADTTSAGRRDAAMLAILLGSGAKAL